MPSEDTKISKLNQYQKSDKAQFTIDADLRYFIEKTDGCRIILKIHQQQK